MRYFSGIIMNPIMNGGRLSRKAQVDQDTVSKKQNKENNREF